MPKKPMRVREQAVVYMSAQDRELLERLAEETGLPKTELFRRGLRRLAEEMLPERAAGSSIDFLVDLPEDADAQKFTRGVIMTRQIARGASSA